MFRIRAWVVGCLLGLTLPVMGAPTVRLGKGTVEVAGLEAKDLAGVAGLSPDAERWKSLFAVYVDKGKSSDDQPAILGTYSVDKGILSFTPRFPMGKGIRYRAVVRASGKPLEVVLGNPRPATRPSTLVRQVYPSGDRLPENMLKFYLHFSAPMSQGDSYRNIQLLDARGKPVDLPFLELDQELWDPSGTRFTLFFDPGRIKRGLKPREEVGPALETGKRYTLVVLQRWEDANGTRLVESYQKTFTVADPDDSTPDHKRWKLTRPTPGTREPLVVTFSEPMDHALAQRLIWVADAAGKTMPGAIELRAGETEWVFTPAKPWMQGNVDLVADTRVEDRSGNNLARPFEIDLLRPVERTIKSQTVKLPLRIGR